MNEETIEFYDFVPEVRERIMELIFNKITPQCKKKNRIREIFEMLEFLVPDEYKNLICELDDLVLADKTNILEKTTFYLLKNGEEIKRSLIGI